MINCNWKNTKENEKLPLSNSEERKRKMLRTKLERNKGRYDLLIHSMTGLTRNWSYIVFFSCNSLSLKANFLIYLPGSRRK